MQNPPSFQECIRLMPFVVSLTTVCASGNYVRSADLPTAEVDGQPLGANVIRLITAMDYLGTPLANDDVDQLKSAAKERDAKRLQKILDRYVLFAVSLNPEVRVKVARGPAAAKLQQSGFTPHIVKVVNESTVSRQLRIKSPQAGPVYSGAAEVILARQAQTELNKRTEPNSADRFLEVEMFRGQPMTKHLSGLEVEYAIAMIYSSESGRREATIAFDVGEGTQDIGFRGEVPVLFDVQPAIAVRVSISDSDGSATAARITIRDADGRVFPPQAKRLAPDFFFQPQIYRHDGGTVLLPPGKFSVTSSRGPEYVNRTSELIVRDDGIPQALDVQLKRWVDPAKFGFYCGDHHIHGAGCSHYDNPTQGVRPEDMFVQVEGEGLNVGCVLTWGPCFDFQRRYFSPVADTLSKPLTVLKYDLEISGFGSAALGHVCLLNLKDQTYPGSDGTSTKGWPTWTVPVMRWTKQQGGVTGYPHSAFRINPSFAANYWLETCDTDRDSMLSEKESADALLPFEFGVVDTNDDGKLSRREFENSTDRAADQIPNYATPAMNGAGAMEIVVSTPEGVCDFISAMDTARTSEWNTWYHLMNCGFPLKLSGETDFPCMSSRRVGQGRVYVQLGEIDRVDFRAWCNGVRDGKSYVSDGFAHALDFRVDGVTPGNGKILLFEPSNVTVQAKVAFAAEQPNAVAYGGITPRSGRRTVGDTVQLHAPRDSGVQQGGDRLVELIVNGQVVESKNVLADGNIHDLSFSVPIERSSWVAIRQFPQLHTNPVEVVVGGQPIRASKRSAKWCEVAARLLWKNRNGHISEGERDAAKKSYDRAIAMYQSIAKECDSE